MKGYEKKERSVLFIDGNNFYHSMKKAGMKNMGYLDYSKISQKLVGNHRHWEETRYYIGQIVNEPASSRKYDDQQRFLSRLRSTHPKITVCLGRIEKRKIENPIAKELKDYLSNLAVKIDEGIYRSLQAIARKSEAFVYVEKAVDVMLAIDLVIMAEQDKFDTAYLLSADGDFTPTVQAVNAHNKKIFSVSLSPGAKLAAAAYKSLRLSPCWFADCYFDT